MLFLIYKQEGELRRLPSLEGLLISWKRSAVRAVSLCSILVGLSPSILAQEETGTVKANSLPVYAQMSAESEVVSTLARGKSVRVTLSVTNGDGMWCSVSDLDSSAKLGFVHCEGLDRRNAPSTAAAGTGAFPSFPFDAGTSNQRPSRAQQRWAIAASAILSRADHEHLEDLPADDSVLELKRLLQDSWGISSHDQLLEALIWIDQGGHRQSFSRLGESTANLSPTELATIVSHLDSEKANSVTMAHRYYAKYSAQSITAWDYARYINLCRWSVAAGYISEDEAWPRVMHAAQILQQTFSSWKEFGANYLIGREFWSLRQTKIDGQTMQSIYQGLLRDPSSAWNRIPWDLPLQPSASFKPGKPDAVEPGATNGGGPALPCDRLEDAVAQGQSSEVETILQSAPDQVNCKDRRNWTPLHHAAFNQQVAIIQVLVKHGASLEAADSDGNTPLHVAATSGSPDAIDVLLQAGAKIDAFNHHRDTPLLNAATEGSAPAVNALLKHRPAMNVSDGDFTPLGIAVYRGHRDVVRLLIDHGANIESQDKNGYTALHVAVLAGKTDLVALLLTADAHVDSRSKRGATPLQLAAERGSVDSSSLLLQYGARVDTRDLHGFTALHIAASNGQADVVDFLLAHGADINSRTESGDTPLHWAAYNGKIDAATLLLQKDANVNASDKDGNTPLHWAAAKGHVEMTELLIANGANMKALTRFGCTPLRGANDFHQVATAKVLLKHGATL